MCYFSIFQVRLESIEAVNKILEEANKRIQPTGMGTNNIFIVTYRIFAIQFLDYLCIV